MTDAAEVVLTASEQEAAYDAAFDAQVAKNEEKPAELLAPAEVATEPVKEEAAPAKPAEPTDDDKLLASIPEDRREAFSARLKHAADAETRAHKLDLDNRSLAGRMSAYQRRYEEAAGKRPAEAAKAATVEQTEEWVQFTTDYPDIAKAIESKYASSLPATETPEIKGVVEYVEQQKRERFLNDAWDAVEAVHAGWRDTGKTKEFQTWKASSPTYEKLASSDDIADAIALFDLYDGHLVKTGTPKTDPAAAAATASLAARREAQVEGARSPSNRAQTPSTNVDLTDPEQLFAMYAAKSNERMKKRYR